MEKNKGGRPSKYTPEVVEEIIKNLELGLNQDDSAKLAGVDDSTFMAWKHKYPELIDQLKEAMLRRKKRNLAIITKASITKWQAAAWDLERRWRAEFASWYHVEHTGQGGGPFQVTHTAIDLSRIDDNTIKDLARIPHSKTNGTNPSE